MSNKTITIIFDPPEPRVETLCRRSNPEQAHAPRTAMTTKAGILIPNSSPLQNLEIRRPLNYLFKNKWNFNFLIEKLNNFI